jgi:acetyltransferase-like isoleucine patch superfamily enzyme
MASRTLYTKSGLPKGILDARNNDRPANTSAFAMLSHYRGGEGPWSKLRSISLGAHVFLNLNCVILDMMAVRFGAGTLIGPAVQIYTADHPRDPLVRRSRAEFGRLIAIGRNVWIGGGAIILPGVMIDDDATILSDRVVTRDVPRGATAHGNPARVQVKSYSSSDRAGSEIVTISEKGCGAKAFSSSMLWRVSKRSIMRQRSPRSPSLKLP